MNNRKSALWSWLRAVALVALLTGRIFPPIGGIDLHVIASVAVAPLIAVEAIRWLPKVHPAWPLVIALFAPLVFSGVIRDDIFTEYGNEKFTALVTSTLLSAAAATLLRDREDVGRFVKAWIVAGMILAAFTLTNASVGTRVTAFGDQNPIWLARAIGTAAIGLAWMGYQRRVPRGLAVAGVVFLIAGALITGSRGPSLGVLAGLVLVTLLTGTGARRVAVTALVAVGIFVVPMIPALAQLRVVGLMSTLGESASDVTRSLMWERSMVLIWDTPGGVGYGNWEREAPSPTHNEYPHNIFLEVTAEAGWLTGAFFALVVAWVIARLLRDRHAPLAILAVGMLAAESVAVSVSGDLNARTFFAMLTLGFVVSWFVRNEQGQDWINPAARRAALSSFTSTSRPVRVAPDVSGLATKLDGGASIAAVPPSK